MYGAVEACHPFFLLSACLMYKQVSVGWVKLQVAESPSSPLVYLRWYKARNSDQERSPITIPTTFVVEFRPHHMRVCSTCQNPKGYDDYKESHNVYDQKNSFHERQSFCQEHIENDAKQRDSDHQQCPVPTVVDIVVVVQDQEAL
jgi:hypothetical protein